MNIRENVSLALTGLRSNIMRSLLTMLGIIIGIGSVIGIVTIGNSLTSSITDAFSGLGMNTISAYVMQTDPDSNKAYSDEDLFTIKMLDDIKTVFPGELEDYSLTGSGPNGTAKNGYREIKIGIIATTSGYLYSDNLEIIAGRFIIERDVLGAKPVIVIDEAAANILYNSPQNAIGKEFKVNADGKVYVYTVVGVVASGDDSPMFSMGYFSSDTQSGYIPLTSYYLEDPQSTLSRDVYYNASFVAKPGVDVVAFSERLSDYINKTYYSRNPYFEIFASTMKSMVDEMTSVMNTVSIGISVIAAISLLVGGIGVMNIMLVSVTERTGEIGTRKALGAKESDIRSQFIIESVILCLIGGIIGIGLGIIIGMIGAALLSSTAVPSAAAIIIAVFFSMFIGVFFGYYPANKAAKLDPIEALRYE